MTAGAIDTVVRERLGLDPLSLGPNVLGRAVEVRMHARGVTDPAVYASRLMTEQVELAALAAELAVSETWFFRGGRSLFDRLAAFVVDHTAGRSPGNAVRTLSIPCSTGEEPYSLAMALHERFLTPDDFTIDAVDLSERALAKAKAARYGAFAFRETGTDIRPAYFRRIEEQWEVLPHLRAAVRFRTGNLTDPLFLADERAYDLIVCRNLFIYLTADGRRRAMANFDRLLALDGRLCVTPGEADRLPPGRFVPDGPTESGVYKRTEVGGVIQPPPAPRSSAPPEAARPVAAPPAPPDITPPPASGTLGVARLLADAGRLDEARVMCEQLLRTRPTDADALSLIGVVYLAGGRTNDALDALRKALYLVPDHAEAMSHMMGLCERRGDTARAAALRRRLALLASKEGA